MKPEKVEKLKDVMREMCVAQGYVPSKCGLPGPIIYALVLEGEDPCARCNQDRSDCGGRPRRDEEKA